MSVAAVKRLPYKLEGEKINDKRTGFGRIDRSISGGI